MSVLPADPVKRGRAQLALLALFFAAPLALAWLAWRLDWAPGATSNYGELVTPPRPLAGPPLEALRAAIDGTHVARAGALAARFPAAGAVTDHIYVLDPLGNLMMRYPRDPDPKRMIEDLQRLLQTSRFG